jgi:hypothetical protein
MKIRFIEDCTVYPNGKETFVQVGQTLDIADAEYAQLLVSKRHADEVKGAEPSRKKGDARDE